MKILRVLGAILFSLVIALGVWLYDPLPNNPGFHALSFESQHYHADIARDQWGIPHIKGERDADASFGLAYAHAEDDFETIQQVVAATRGQIASYQGIDAVATDYLVGLLGVWETVARRYQEDVPEDVKAIARSYAAGLNLYAARHPELTWRGLAPFKAEDVIAGFIFKTPLFYGLDQTLIELLDERRDVEISMYGDHAFSVSDKTSVQLGSNAIAVAAKRSPDNTSRLLINSHQPMTGPVAWYEAHIESKQGLNIIGGVFPGTPVILGSLAAQC